ncbi:MAG: hypothetical protein WKF73_21580 [Nocardioidaceae bacterium]
MSPLNFTQTDAERKAGEIGLGDRHRPPGGLDDRLLRRRLRRQAGCRATTEDGKVSGFGSSAWWCQRLRWVWGSCSAGSMTSSTGSTSPNLPIPTDTLTSGGLIALAAVLAGTLLAAFVGGKVGQRYHSKIDRITA